MIKWAVKEKEKIILEFNKSNSKIKDFVAHANIYITTLNNDDQIKNNQKEINLLKKRIKEQDAKIEVLEMLRNAFSKKLISGNKFIKMQLIL